jgi:hypothetical protein
MSITEAVVLAAPSFTGELLLPTNSAYEERRRVHNGLIDKHPVAIASCHGVADTSTPRLARPLGLGPCAAEVTTLGATIDGGPMIDPSPMGHSRRRPARSALRGRLVKEPTARLSRHD